MNTNIYTCWENFVLIETFGTMVVQKYAVCTANSCVNAREG